MVELCIRLPDGAESIRLGRAVVVELSSSGCCSFQVAGFEGVTSGRHDPCILSRPHASKGSTC